MTCAFLVTQTLNFAVDNITGSIPVTIRTILYLKLLWLNGQQSLLCSGPRVQVRHRYGVQSISLKWVQGGAA